MDSEFTIQMLIRLGYPMDSYIIKLAYNHKFGFQSCLKLLVTIPYPDSGFQMGILKLGYLFQL